jgi:hypothetical protein
VACCSSAHKVSDEAIEQAVNAAEAEEPAPALAE